MIGADRLDASSRFDGDASAPTGRGSDTPSAARIVWEKFLAIVHEGNTHPALGASSERECHLDTPRAAADDNALRFVLPRHCERIKTLPQCERVREWPKRNGVLPDAGHVTTRRRRSDVDRAGVERDPLAVHVCSARGPVDLLDRFIHKGTTSSTCQRVEIETDSRRGVPSGEVSGDHAGVRREPSRRHQEHLGLRNGPHPYRSEHFDMGVSTSHKKESFHRAPPSMRECTANATVQRFVSCSDSKYATNAK